MLFGLLFEVLVLLVCRWSIDGCWLLVVGCLLFVVLLCCFLLV